MATNTFLPDDNDGTQRPISDDTTYMLPPVIDTSQPPATARIDNEAANLIREKVARIYADEPNPEQEAQEAEAAKSRSAHQQFMYQLSNSGKDLATIQTEWHNYYIALPDEDKHQVWQEFYAGSASAAITIAQPQLQKTAAQPTVPQQPQVGRVISIDEAQAMSTHKNETLTSKRRRPSVSALADIRNAKDIQKIIRDKVSAGGSLKAKHHLQSLLFGLGMGSVVIIIFLFSFFNEIIIAPFIQPSRVDAATPGIVSSAAITASSTPEVIIPKINVEIPVDYSETSTSESVIESDLEDGIVHYPTTVMPGQDGNAAFFGHSSNNILNGGKYKFAFVLLHLLVPGDTFYLTYQGKVYIYKVISKTVVNPSDVSVLNSVAGQVATATLITCDPPGTSLNRLVIVGQQVSPDPSADTAGTPTVTAPITTLPGNGPSLWTRLTSSIFGKFLVSLVALVLIGITVRWSMKMWRLRNDPYYV
jgi:LPXTG-site transpeptidase (sortase) family protein